MALDIIENAKDNPQYILGQKVSSAKKSKKNSFDFDMNHQRQELLEMEAKDFKITIDANEQEIKEKIAKGYIYKPHKKGLKL